MATINDPAIARRCVRLEWIPCGGLGAPPNTVYFSIGPAEAGGHVQITAPPGVYELSVSEPVEGLVSRSLCERKHYDTIKHLTRWVIGGRPAQG
jgi:hypothetical protein